MNSPATEIESLKAEVARLRRLDAEYGQLEAAIIMADREFDGDSDHPDCISRLMDSVRRIQGRLAKLEAVAEAASGARDIARNEIDQPGNIEHRYRALKSVFVKLDAALNGEKDDD